MKSAADILGRTDAEVSAGRNWRAKEILRGAIAGGRADPAVLERYGRLLESLGERLEAGKYLFLSGVRIPEYAEAIALFRTRHAKRRGSALVSLLPAGIRRMRFGDLPGALQRDLIELGVTEAVFERSRRAATALRFRDRVTIAGALVVTAVFVLALILGIGVLGEWLWSFFGRAGA